ncbi:MAG: helix-hairpin-helix domain-containing protein [Propionibacteriaceae bacterium]
MTAVGPRDERDDRPLDLLDDWDEPPPRRAFGRAHVGVICALLLIGLLSAGWAVLRARPVAIASTPAGGVTSSPLRSSPTATATPTPAPASIMVHVLGAVKKPGVVTLPEHARVRDAIEAAGGLRREAAPEELNLAQVLSDGQQVVIGTDKAPSGEVRDGGQSSGSNDSSSSGSSSSDDAGPKVNLNSASQAQLEELPGVGPVTAGKIVAWREEHGRFSRVEELQEVDGIGPKTFAEIAPHARV